MSRGHSRGCYNAGTGFSPPRVPASAVWATGRRPYRKIMDNIGRFLMIGGIVLFVVGGLVFLAAKVGIPFGRLPGDIRIERDGFSFYFPLGSSILISIVFTIVINVVLRLLKK